MYLYILTIICILISFIIILGIAIYLSTHDYLLYNMRVEIERKIQDTLRVNHFKAIICFFKGHQFPEKSQSGGFLVYCKRCNKSEFPKHILNLIYNTKTKEIMENDNAKTE